MSPADPGFRRDGGEQEAAVRDAGQVPAQGGGAGGVAHQAGNLNLVHRIDHGGRGAGPAQAEGDIGHGSHAHASAAQLGRDMRAQQPALAHRQNGLRRKAPAPVHVIGRRGGGADGVGDGARVQCVIYDAA